MRKMLGIAMVLIVLAAFAMSATAQSKYVLRFSSPTAKEHAWGRGAEKFKQLVADETKGEAVKAWVVLRGGQAATEADLRAFCREKLAPYKVPSRIEFRHDLPKTMVGKVLRRALKEGG